MFVQATAPTRVDFVGGTTDLEPLYLWLGGSKTLNAGIDLKATVTIKENDKNKIVVYSKDLDQKMAAKSWDKLPEGKLELARRALVYFQPDRGLSMEMESSVPKGSGLAASTALNLALVKALSIFLAKDIDDKDLIRVTKDLETQVVGVPTGWQDYYPEVYGGVNLIELRVGEVSGLRMDISEEFKKTLAERMVLVFTGESHFSGENNWQIFKDMVEGKRKTKKALNALVESSAAVIKAFEDEDFDAFSQKLRQDWELRKELTKKVSTKQIERIEEVLDANGFPGFRVCGAGGGGCMLIDSRGEKDKVDGLVSAVGARFLPFKFDYQGLNTEVSNE